MRNFEDTYKHQGLRRRLLDEIIEKGIDNQQVLNAIDKVPRHFYLDQAFENIAYEDRAFPITAGQTISQPFTVAYQTSLLNPQPFEKILEIGTGSCYQCAVLAELKAQVYTIERQKALYDLSGASYTKKKYPNIKYFFGDGFLGLPTYAPFDKILITAAAPFIPEKLVEQLKEGGIMVIPLGEGEVQQMIRGTKVNGALEIEYFKNFSFVPMLAGKNKV
jgi:protein-L-isoaspartate(D-aspartate) O-methyltransferase